MGRTFALSQSVDTPVAGYRNALINGNFDIWQRGTSINATASTAHYGPDRWLINRGNATIVMTREAVTPGADFGNGLCPPYLFHISQSTSGIGTSLEQRIENVRTFEGRTCTFSGWAHSEGKTGFLIPNLYQYWDGSTPTNTALSSVTLPTNTWTRFEKTFTVPSASGKTIGSGSFLSLTLNLPYDSSYITRLTCLQLEPGPVATPFEERPLAVELALCQRYYEKNYNQDTAPGTAGGLGFYGYIEYGVAASSGHPAFWPYKVPKRASPTLTPYDDAGTSGKGSFGGVGNVTIGLYGGPNALRYFVNTGSTISVGSWQDFYWTAVKEF